MICKVSLLLGNGVATRLLSYRLKLSRSGSTAACKTCSLLWRRHYNSRTDWCGTPISTLSSDCRKPADINAEGCHHQREKIGGERSGKKYKATPATATPDFFVETNHGGAHCVIFAALSEGLHIQVGSSPVCYFHHHPDCGLVLSADVFQRKELQGQ